eukprot:scaffold87715_cov32-Tisochrysis_lutea.AAC.4
MRPIHDGARCEGKNASAQCGSTHEIEQIAVRVQYRQLTQVTKLFVRFEAPQRRELLIRDESSRIPRTWLESWYDGGSAALNGIIKSRDKEIITNAIQIERAKHHRQ